MQIGGWYGCMRGRESLESEYFLYKVTTIMQFLDASENEFHQFHVKAL
jgi:hypothetical protein